MKLRIDTTQMIFQIGANEPMPKTDQHGNQRREKGSEMPLWVTDVVAYDQVPNNRGLKETDTIRVTTAGDKPKVHPMEAVNPVELEAIAWSMDKNSGISYRAKELLPVQAGKTAKASA